MTGTLVKFVNRFVDIEQLMERNVVSIMIGPSLHEDPITKERYPAIWLSMDKIEINFAGQKTIKRDIMDLACEDFKQCQQMLFLICDKYKKNFSIFSMEEYIEEMKKENAAVDISIKEIEKITVN